MMIFNSNPRVTLVSDFTDNTLAVMGSALKMFIRDGPTAN